MQPKIQIKGLKDVQKSFDVYLKNTEKTAQHFIKEIAGTSCNYLYARALPLGKNPKQMKDVGQKMINKDLANTYLGVKRTMLLLRSKNPKVVKVWLALINDGKIIEANKILIENGIVIQQQNLTEEMHKKNWNGGKVKEDPQAIPSKPGMIQKLQKKFLANVSIGKSAWAFVGFLLGTKSRISKSLQKKGIQPVIKEKVGKITVINPSRYASHLISSAKIKECLNLGIKNTLKAWNNAQRKLTKGKV